MDPIAESRQAENPEKDKTRHHIMIAWLGNLVCPFLFASSFIVHFTVPQNDLVFVCFFLNCCFLSHLFVNDFFLSDQIQVILIRIFLCLDNIVCPV